MLSLEQLLTMSEDDLFFALAVHPEARIGNGFVWWSRGAPVLGTAHLDVVVPEHAWTDFWAEETSFGEFIKSPALDGRLGVYALVELYERYPIDALFTTDEEVRFSTARLFKPAPYHQWAFTFNLASPLPWRPTCALPALEDKALLEALTEVGYRVDVDAYSDVVELRRRGLPGVNLGVGYRAQHTQECSVYLADFDNSLAVFESFLNKHIHTPFKGECHLCLRSSS
jgi:putative aminopeptidase FrvX